MVLATSGVEVSRIGQRAVPARAGQRRRTGEDLGLLVRRQRVEPPREVVQNGALDVGVIPSLTDGVLGKR